MKCLRDASRAIFLLALMGLLFSVNPSSAPAQTPPLDAPPLLLDDPLDEQSLEDLENELFDSEDSEELEDSGDERSRRGGLRRYFPRWRSVDAYERNHRSVRQAFREPVREASRATIQVFADNERVAMGTIVDPNGLVFTKASEIGGELECRLRDGRRVKAHLISVREELDLAILRIDADNLPVIQWRDSAVPLEGSWLATTGMQEIPTAVGVVSVSPREIPTPQAVLGVMLDNADLGPRITGIIPESAAEEAGVQVDDIVSDLNGLPMPNREVFIEAIQRKRPGDRIKMTVLRGDQRVAINAKAAREKPDPARKAD
jgi:S1-C subfamily serine protease